MRRNWALSRGIAEWVEVRPTRLPLGSHERGLFVVSTLSTELEGCYRNADGRNVIRKGTYIGLYRGEFKPRNGSAQPYRVPQMMTPGRSRQDVAFAAVL